MSLHRLKSKWAMNKDEPFRGILSKMPLQTFRSSWVVRSVFGDIDGKISNDDVSIARRIVCGNLFSGQHVEGVSLRPGVEEATLPRAKLRGGHLSVLLILHMQYLLRLQLAVLCFRPDALLLGWANCFWGAAGCWANPPFLKGSHTT